MKIGKGPSGLIGITTNERSVKIWANGHHLCGELLTELEALRDNQQTGDNMHKEEGTGRMNADAEDRRKIRTALHKCIHPLDITSHPSNSFVNINTGEEAYEKVKVNKAVEMGKEKLKKFQESLPEGFRERLSSTVVTMSEAKSKKKNSTVGHFSTDLIFYRVMYLLGTNQLNFSVLFNFELAPVPTSLFKDSGEAQYTKSKADLVKKMKVEISTRGVRPQCVVVDGGGMLHLSLHWPKDGVVVDLVSGVEQYIGKIH